MRKEGKRKALAALVCGSMLSVALVGGTLAYLTDTDSNVNVMTLGDVKIEQIEQERDADGDLVEFKQEKPLFPAVYGGDSIPWADESEWVEEGEQAWKVVEGNSNVIDKFVTVKNTGESEAYVRTLVAIEVGDGSAASDYIHVVANGKNVGSGEVIDWQWLTDANDESVTIAVNGATYEVAVATYLKPVASEETTIPSLKQVYLDKDATNEVVASLGSEYTILVLSQAVQTSGFDSAQTALETAFPYGDNNVNLIDWFEKAYAKDGPAAANDKAMYNGTEYSNIYDAVAAANANGGGVIELMGHAQLDKPVEIASNVSIEGAGYGVTYSRAEGYTGTMFTVKAGATLAVENLALDGSGAAATGNLIATEGNGSIVLGEGAVLKNNNGAHAVSLATRGGGTLTLNGAEIVNNSSDSGAIWGGGHITVNEGSKISNNSSTGLAGAIRMVGNCNLTMNGGEISGNKAAGDGGAIWGYGSSTYNFNGGKMSNNESAGTGGAIYTGTYSVINISGDFEMCGNKAANSGAIRLTDHTSLSMAGGKVSGNTQNGESNAFNTWNNSISLTGGEIADDISYVGGLGLTVGKAEIDGVIYYDLSTNHNTAYLAAEFNGFKFKVDESNANFASFNFKPAAGYAYTAGDEAKLVCVNEGYETYWDAATSTFKLKPNND